MHSNQNNNNIKTENSRFQVTEVKMAPINILENPTAWDKELLVKNNSVHSFDSDTNEFTVTRPLNARKYSMMHFKPLDRNKMDIVITKGEYDNGNGNKPTLPFSYIGSQDIRKQYSIKAKVAVAIVLTLIGAMAVCLIYSMLNQESFVIGKEDGEMTTINTANASLGVNLYQTINSTNGIAGDQHNGTKT